MRLFTKHPNARGMTYFQHCCAALKLGYVLGCGSIGIMIHAIFPFLFETIATDTADILGQCLKNSQQNTTSNTHN